MTKVSRVKLEANESGAEIRIGELQELVSINKYKWKCNGCNMIYGFRESALECADLHQGINYRLKNIKKKKGETFRIRHRKYGLCNAEALEDSYIKFGDYYTDIRMTK